MNRYLNLEEKILIKRVLEINDTILDNIIIYINQTWIKYTFYDYYCHNQNGSIYGMTFCNSIYFSFDPDFNICEHMELIIYEIVHILQCNNSCCCIIMVRYIWECMRYGLHGMYEKDGTLEFEATKNQKMVRLIV